MITARIEAMLVNKTLMILQVDRNLRPSWLVLFKGNRHVSKKMELNSKLAKLATLAKLVYFTRRIINDRASSLWMFIVEISQN